MFTSNILHSNGSYSMEFPVLTRPDQGDLATEAFIIVENNVMKEFSMWKISVLNICEPCRAIVIWRQNLVIQCICWPAKHTNILSRGLNNIFCVSSYKARCVDREACLDR